MKVQKNYKYPPNSDQLAPYITITVKNPLREEKTDIDALIDTGYDRYLLVSENIYLKLGLDEFEYPKSSRVKAQLYDGRIIELRSAPAETILKDLDISQIDDIDAMKNVTEALAGRKFLEYYETLLDGPNKAITLSYDSV